MFFQGQRTTNAATAGTETPLRCLGALHRVVSPVGTMDISAGLYGTWTQPVLAQRCTAVRDAFALSHQICEDALATGSWWQQAGVRDRDSIAPLLPECQTPTLNPWKPPSGGRLPKKAAARNATSSSDTWKAVLKAEVVNVLWLQTFYTGASCEGNASFQRSPSIDAPAPA